MTEFEGLVDGDTQYLGIVIDNIDDYTAALIYEKITQSSAHVVQGILGDHQEARDALTARLNELLLSGGTTLDGDAVQQYCMVLLPLIEEINQANLVNGVQAEQANLDQAQQQEVQRRIDAAEQNLRGYLQQSRSVYDAIIVSPDHFDEGLATYLERQLNEGGCNNVFASNAHSVVAPLAQHGYIRFEQATRDYLTQQYHIVV
jgi:hypothetical protein